MSHGSEVEAIFDEIAAHTRDFSHELAAKKTYVVKKTNKFSKNT